MHVIIQWFYGQVTGTRSLCREVQVCRRRDGLTEQTLQPFSPGVLWLKSLRLRYLGPESAFVLLRKRLP